MEILKVFNILTLKQDFWKTKSFFWKTGAPFLISKLPLLKAQYLTCQNSLLRQIERGVQNGPIKKTAVLSLAILCFCKFNVSKRTSFKYLV